MCYRFVFLFEFLFRASKDMPTGPNAYGVFALLFSLLLLVSCTYLVKVDITYR
jgi:hypothetical protein